MQFIAHLEPGLLIGFGNQVWVLFDEVGVERDQSAAGGPRLFMGWQRCATVVLFLTLIDRIKVLMIFAQETFNDTWPFKPNFFSGNGFKMHYVDEGKGTPIICLHGEPTWG